MFKVTLTANVRTNGVFAHIDLEYQGHRVLVFNPECSHPVEECITNGESLVNELHALLETVGGCAIPAPAGWFEWELSGNVDWQHFGSTGEVRRLSIA